MGREEEKTKKEEEEEEEEENGVAFIQRDMNLLLVITTQWTQLGKKKVLKMEKKTRQSLEKGLSFSHKI